MTFFGPTYPWNVPVGKPKLCVVPLPLASSSVVVKLPVANMSYKQSQEVCMSLKKCSFGFWRTLLAQVLCHGVCHCLPGPLRGFCDSGHSLGGLHIWCELTIQEGLITKTKESWLMPPHQNEPKVSGICTESSCSGLGS